MFVYILSVLEVLFYLQLGSGQEFYTGNKKLIVRVVKKPVVKKKEFNLYVDNPVEMGKISAFASRRDCSSVHPIAMWQFYSTLMLS